MSYRINLRARSNEIAIIPGRDLSVRGEDFAFGPHTVVISGFVDLQLLGAEDDEICKTHEVRIDIDDVLWEPEFLQASTMTSWGEVHSGDADEVDLSTWGIRAVQTGHIDFGTVSMARKIRLLLDVVVQGDKNVWRRIGFQIVANGTLKDVPATLAYVNETKTLV